MRNKIVFNSNPVLRELCNWACSGGARAAFVAVLLVLGANQSRASWLSDGLGKIGGAIGGIGGGGGGAAVATSAPGQNDIRNSRISTSAQNCVGTAWNNSSVDFAGVSTSKSKLDNVTISTSSKNCVGTAWQNSLVSFGRVAN